MKKIDTVEEMPPLRDLLVEAAQIGQSASRDLAPRFTGAMAQGFVSEISPFSAKVHTITAIYPIVIEGGRKPGSTTPSSRVLEQWARRHGIENTFLLARAIAKRGIRGRFFRRKGRVAVRREMPRLLGEMQRKLEVIWGKPLAEVD